MILQSLQRVIQISKKSKAIADSLYNKSSDDNDTNSNNNRNNSDVVVEKGDVYIEEEVGEADLETESRELWELQLQYDVYNSFDMLDSIEQVNEMELMNVNIVIIYACYGLLWQISVSLLLFIVCNTNRKLNY